MHRGLVASLAFALSAFLSACDVAAPAATPAPGSVPEVTATPSSAPPVTATPSSAPTATTSTPPAPPAVGPELKVAYVLDSSVDGATERTLPALQAMQLAFATASLERAAPPVDLVPFDLLGDRTRLDALRSEIAADPGYVAIVVAPSFVAQRDVQALGVPVVSLAARDGRDPDAGPWLRLVPRVHVVGATLGAAVAEMSPSRGGVCVGPPAPDGSRFASAALATLGDVPVEAVGDAEEIRSDGCRVIVWTGDASSAAAVLTDLGRPRPRFVGGPALLEPAFLSEADGLARGVEAICGCGDVSTSLELPAQRFIQDFQSEFGTAPGPLAVEAWDAAHLVVRGLEEGGTTRNAFGEWLGGVRRYAGLGGSYRFARDGELLTPDTRVWGYRVEGARWVRAEPVR